MNTVALEGFSEHVCKLVTRVNKDSDDFSWKHILSPKKWQTIPLLGPFTERLDLTQCE